MSNKKPKIAAQSARRARVARLSRSGYDAGEIAEKIGSHPATVRKDLRILEERWYWASRQDTQAQMQQQLAHLDDARSEAWKAYHEYENRHGEGHQNGYLNTVVKTTQAIADLLRLSDPHSEAAGYGSTESQAKVVEVTVSTREQADMVQRGSIDFEDLQQLGGTE